MIFRKPFLTHPDVILCDFNTDEKLFTIANIYAPNEDDTTFLKKAFDHLHDFACEEITLEGDFNLVFVLRRITRAAFPEPTKML